MKSKFVSLTTSTNASVVLTSPTTTDNYYDTFGTLQTRSRTPRFGRVEVVNIDGGAPVYVRVDGTNPTVDGDDSYGIAALKDANVVIPVNDTSVTVRLISSGSAKVSVIAY